MKIHTNSFKIIEGSLEVKLPTIWTDEKQRWEESEKRREEKKKEDQTYGMLPIVCSCDSSSNWPACRLFFADGVAVHVFPIYALHALQGVWWRKKIKKDKVSEERRSRSRKTLCFFHWFVAPEGRKVGSLKRRVRSQLARWEMKNCTPLWCEAHVQLKQLKTPRVRSTAGQMRDEKLHVVVVRSTFPSQNVQNTPSSDHFWKLRWREAHFEVKMLKALHVWSTFGRSDVVLRGRRKGLCT